MLERATDRETAASDAGKGQHKHFIVFCVRAQMIRGMLFFATARKHEARELSLHTHIWLRGADPQLPRVVVRKEQLMTHI